MNNHSEAGKTAADADRRSGITPDPSDTADFADHRVASGAEGRGAFRRILSRRWVAVADFGVDGIAVLQAIQASARLHRRIEVGGGDREPACRDGAGSRSAALT